MLYLRLRWGMELSILEGFLEEAKGGYAFQWEKPHCEAEKILLRGWPVWLLDSLLAWRGRLPTSIPRNIRVAGAEPFLGSAGGG